MSTTTHPPKICVWSIDSHRFVNKIKCAIGCKNPGYKTYTYLHKHYLETHQICLHRVARLDTNNEDEFRAQVASSLAHLRVGGTTSQGSRELASNPLALSPSRIRSRDLSGRATSHVNQPPVTAPPPQTAGPSHTRGYQTPSDANFHPSPAALGQDGLLNPPSWYSASVPISAGNPYQTYSPGLRFPVSAETGPSRSPAMHPATRYQPYSQSRPQQQRLRHSPSHGQPKGKGREIPSIPIYSGLPTPETPSLTPTPQYSTNITAQDASRQPATAQVRVSPTDSPQQSEAPQPADSTWPTQLRDQPQPDVTASSYTAIHLPTPPMGTDLFSGGSPSPPLKDKHNRAPRRVNQKGRIEPPGTTVAGTPSPLYAPQQVVSHPYRRPANGSTTSQQAKQARENRRQDLMTKADATREALAHSALPLGKGQTRAVVDARYPAPDRHCQEQNHPRNPIPWPLEVQEEETPFSADWQIHLVNPPVGSAPPHFSSSDTCALFQLEEPTPVSHLLPPPVSATAWQGQTIDELPATWEGSDLWLHESLWAQDQSDPSEQPQAADEFIPPFLTVQEPYQEPPLIQQYNWYQHVPVMAEIQEPPELLEVLYKWWWGPLIETPDGLRIPE